MSLLRSLEFPDISTAIICHNETKAVFLQSGEKYIIYPRDAQINSWSASVQHISQWVLCSNAPGSTPLLIAYDRITETS